jgi:hypothetical protein
MTRTELIPCVQHSQVARIGAFLGFPGLLFQILCVYRLEFERNIVLGIRSKLFKRFLLPPFSFGGNNRFHLGKPVITKGAHPFLSVHSYWPASFSARKHATRMAFFSAFVQVERGFKFM